MTLIGLLGAVAATLLTTPTYQASTRLFVSTAAGDSLADVYQGTLFSQERVLSYTELLTGETVAQRTIDELNLGMTASELAEKVTATAKPDTVLINVEVSDESAVRARDIANALSDEFVTVARELETPEDGSTPDARVVVEQRATTPNDPITPKTLNNLLTGLAIGAFAGFGLALLRHYLDTTVKLQDELENIASTGLVGTIPVDKSRKLEPAIAFEGDTSAIAEAFRKLRTNLQFIAVDHPPRVIVIASSAPGEGKSTTAINIASALAEAGHSVCLVDGDMRRPMLAKYLNVVGTVGLTTVLSGAVQLAQALQETSTPGLTVLASGPTPPNPSELLGSVAAKKVLSELRTKFDYVIVDSSPLLAVTDAAILAAAADGVLILARFGHTKRDHLAIAVGNVRDVGAQVLGAVFTMTPPQAQSYDYSSYGDRTSQDSSESQSPRDRHRRSRASK